MLVLVVLVGMVIPQLLLQLLEQVCYKPGDAAFRVSTQPYNLPKNCYPDKLPCEHILHKQVHVHSFLSHICSSTCISASYFFVFLFFSCYSYYSSLLLHILYSCTSYIHHSILYLTVNVSRPRLRPDGTIGADYINANFVDVNY